MNKLFTKIAALALGATMAIGVGVAVGTSKSASRVDAVETVTLAYTGGVTGNFAENTNIASQVGLSNTDWNVRAIKGSASNNVGYNKDNDIRLYYNASGSNTLSVTSTQSWTITSIAITYTGNTYNNATITPGTGSNTGTTGNWTIGSTSFVIGNGNTSNTQVRIKSVVITYATGSKTPLNTPSPVYNKTNDRVTWTADTHADHYVVSTDGGTNWSNATSSSYHDVSSFAIHTSHTLKVKAVAPTGSSTYEDSGIGSVTFAKFAHAGTEADPYDVADARAAIDASYGTSGVYVTGIVSAIPTPYSDQHNNITFNIVDEAGDENFIQAYRCAGTEANQVTMGDNAVVSGNLTKFGSTYEFAEGCTLISLEHPVVTITHIVTFSSNGGTDPSDIEIGDNLSFIFPSPGTKSGYIFKGWTLDESEFYQEGDTSPAVDDDWDFEGIWQTKGTASNPYSVSEALAAITNNTGLKSACVSGIISSVDSYSSGSITYQISVDGTTSNQLEVYKGKGLNGADFSSKADLSVGTSVVVQGNLKDYNGKSEFDTGSIILEIVVKFTVTYDGNGSTGGTVPTDSSSPYVSGSTVTVLGNTGSLVKTGYTWSGWNTQSDGQGTHYDATNTFTISANTTLYAEWIVTLDAITSIGGTVTGLVSSAGTTNWDFSNVTVTGTISGVANQDVKAYVDLTSSTTIPSTGTASMTVSITATRKSNISGTAVPLTSDVTGSVLSYENSSSLIPGDYYIKYDTHYFTGSVSSGKGASSLTKPGDAGKFTFSLIGNDTWSIINAEGNRLGITANDSTKLFVGENNVYTFLIIDGSNGTFKLNSRDFTNRYVGYRSESEDFRTYTDGNPIELTLESAKTVSSFSVYSVGANKNVLQGSTFNAAAAQAAGFEARLNYTDSTYDDVTSLATWTLDTSTVGTATLTVTYESYTPVTINDMNIYAVTIVSLSIDATNAKTSGYWVGDTLDTNGLVITGYDSSDNEYSIAVGDCAFSPTTLTIAGNSITITVSYPNESGDPATGTYTVSVAQFAYSKASSINGGDQILLTNIAETKYMSGISTTTTIYGIATAYEGKPGTEHVYTVVAGSSDGTFAFKNSDGYYLNWATGNSLNTVSTITENSSWTVSFDGTTASIVNASDSTRVIRFNSDRFATYASSTGTLVSIWKLNGASGQVAAEGFASEFISEVVNKVCKAFGPDFEEDMEFYWEYYALEYDELSPEAKAYIASKSASASGDDVEKMLYEYKHIYETYGDELNISNFLGRIEVSKTPLAPRTPIVNIVGENGNAITIVVIVSVISLTAIGGYFFLRKRREQN